MRATTRDQYGVAAVHYYWLGAVPAMVFLGLVKFFVIVAALLPLTLVALHAVGGVDGLVSRVKHLGPDPRRGGRGGVATVNRRQRRGGGAGREGRQPARRPQADRGLFALYGLILPLLGLFGSHHIKHKAAGINVDLWTGIGMRIFAALMIFWALSKPVAPEPEETRGQGSGRIRRAPAT